MKIGEIYDFGRDYEQWERREEVFEGPLRDWADYHRQAFDETVEPVVLIGGAKEKELHQVAWVYRSVEDPDTHEYSCRYHVACDCTPALESQFGPEMPFGYCEVLAGILILRASQVSPAFINEESDPSQAMLDILHKEREAPDLWLANYLSGEHELTMLSLILKRELEEIHEAALDMKEAGIVTIKEQTIRLAA